MEEIPTAPGSPFSELKVVYHHQGSLHTEWVTFNEAPMTSRFRTKTANLVQIRPLWHSYVPQLTQPSPIEGSLPFIPGSLPDVEEHNLERGWSKIILITRGGPFSYTELGTRLWYAVQNCQLYAIRPTSVSQITPSQTSSAPLLPNADIDVSVTAPTSLILPPFNSLTPAEISALLDSYAWNSS